MIKRRNFLPAAFLSLSLLVNACGSSPPNTSASPTSPSTATGASPAPSTPAGKKKVGIILDRSENDKSFNEYSLKGAREAAKAAGLDFSYVVAASTSDFEKNIETQVNEGAGLVITVGFLMADATAAMAKKYPQVKFAIVDVSYPPEKDGSDPYAKDLKNVTSLVFAEDQVAFLAGALAGCVSESGKIAVVAGMEIPPVQKFVDGYSSGAKFANPSITVLKQYIPSFEDPATGKSVGQNFISQGADVIFGAGGSTGNGGLLAAKEANKKAIGVDVDQYLTYPEVKSALLTSAAKNMDVAVGTAVKDFAAGSMKPGIQLSTLANGGLGLAPYHEWETKIDAKCKNKVKAAETAVKADPKVTGSTK